MTIFSHCQKRTLSFLARNAIYERVMEGRIIFQAKYDRYSNIKVDICVSLIKRECK
jgi:hypothetical protein